MGTMFLLLTQFAQADFALPMTELESKATVYFISPAGQGALDGSTEGNALPFARFQPFISELKASAKLILLPGTYELADTVTLKAPTDQILVLEGRENAVLHGSFKFNTAAGTSSGLRLQSSNIIVRGLHFQNTGFCVKANKSSVVRQVLIENIDAANVHSCIVVDRDTQQPVTQWIIRNSRIKGYYRSGIRLAGAESHDFLIDNVQIDGAHTEGKSDCFKSGIQLLAGVSNVDIRNTTIENTIGSCGEDYQQGDGIEADHKEGTPKNINLDKVRVSNSGDAEIDMKADNVTMKDVVIIGGDLSRYAFKVWSYKNYQCTNCYAYGVHKAYINLNEAGMTFNASAFANSSPVHLCDLRNGTAPDQQAFVKFNDAQMYVGNEEWINDCGAGVIAGVKRLAAGRIAPPSTVTNLESH